MTRKDKNFGSTPLHLLAKLDRFNTLFLTLETFSPYDKIQGKHVCILTISKPSYFEMVMQKLFVTISWRDLMKGELVKRDFGSSLQK